ncbi:hypothetical protein [Winogradskyella sp. A3E31]|uniref:hypothetical protein n=1 Tax=Winogradskyella sp. A3E31 TaxID=3349637 RepID=UPI00398B6BFA
MKALPIVLLALFLITSCKDDTTKEEVEIQDIEQDTEEVSIAQKIANAHGFEHWENVKSIDFTFQVDTESKEGNERIWKWNPNTNEVTRFKEDETISYLRSDVDSTTMTIDRAFINDKYWLMVPFQLVWDSSATISEPSKAEAPVSKNSMNKITLTYPSDSGGYTPGDAYDVFYDDSFVIREWTFRRGNSKEPTMSTTFESYRDYNGVILALEHKMAEAAGWNLNFTNVNVTFK